MCDCAELAQRSFRCIEESVYGLDQQRVIARSDLVLRLDDRWMSLYRCRECGMHWAEAATSSGHMDLFHLFPAPNVPDREEWLRTTAEPLPLQKWL